MSIYFHSKLHNLSCIYGGLMFSSRQFWIEKINNKKVYPTFLLTRQDCFLCWTTFFQGSVFLIILSYLTAKWYTLIDHYLYSIPLRSCESSHLLSFFCFRTSPKLRQQFASLPFLHFHGPRSFATKEEQAGFQPVRAFFLQTTVPSRVFSYSLHQW